MFTTYQPPLTPLSADQIDFFQEQGYVLIKGGMSFDLIDAFNRHIFDIRNQDPIPEWAACEPSKRFALRLFNPHKQDSFSDR